MRVMYLVLLFARHEMFVFSAVCGNRHEQSVVCATRCIPPYLKRCLHSSHHINVLLSQLTRNNLQIIHGINSVLDMHNVLHAYRKITQTRIQECVFKHTSQRTFPSWCHDDNSEINNVHIDQHVLPIYSFIDGWSDIHRASIDAAVHVPPPNEKSAKANACVYVCEWRSASSRSHLILEASTHMHDSIDRSDVREEGVPKSRSCRCALDESRDVHHLQERRHLRLGFVECLSSHSVQRASLTYEYIIVSACQRKRL